MRHQKFQNKQLKNSTLELENNFKPTNISINDMVNSKKEQAKKRTFAKTLGMIATTGYLTIFLSL